TVIAAIGAFLAVAGYWRVKARMWKKGLTAAGAALAVVLAFMARVNVYELMFHPLDHPSFTTVAEVKLDCVEKVVAVRVGGESRASPVRSMSYHHVVNDVLGGAAIVATY